MFCSLGQFSVTQFAIIVFTVLGQPVSGELFTCSNKHRCFVVTSEISQCIPVLEVTPHFLQCLPVLITRGKQGNFWL